MLAFQLEVGLARAAPPHLLLQSAPSQTKTKANPPQKALPTTASKEDGSLNHHKQRGKKINTSGHGGGRKGFRREGESRAKPAKKDLATELSSLPRAARDGGQTPAWSFS